MALKKVHIEMDEGWVWWIPGENGPRSLEEGTEKKTSEVDEEWIEELNYVTNRYMEMQRTLEVMYRLQEGMKPFKN